jgi:hypothetical protein
MCIYNYIYSIYIYMYIYIYSIYIYPYWKRVIPPIGQLQYLIAFLFRIPKARTTTPHHPRFRWLHPSGSARSSQEYGSGWARAELRKRVKKRRSTATKTHETHGMQRDNWEYMTLNFGSVKSWLRDMLVDELNTFSDDAYQLSPWSGSWNSLIRRRGFEHAQHGSFAQK